MSVNIKKIGKEVTRSFFPHWVEKRDHKKRYEKLAGETGDLTFTFMNYGYAPLSENEAGATLERPYEEFKFHASLYKHVAGQIDLTDLNVLEVGSGRGGGSYYIKKYLGAASVTGLDLSYKAVELCKKEFPMDNLFFKQGDAENLPFEENSFDAVVNVESSHCYPDLLRFFLEVKRVLRPGGHFLYTDFGTNSQMNNIKERLKESGLSLIQFTDITANVVKSIEEDNERRKKMFRSISDSDERFEDLASFARLVGTRGYKDFCRREEIYESFLLIKED